MTDELARRIKSFQDRKAKANSSQEQRTYQSNAAHVARDFAAFVWFVTQVAIAFGWIFQNVVRPIWKQARRPIWWFMRQYKRLWDAIVITHDPYGNPIFSKTRAGCMVLATIIVWWYLLFPSLTVLADTAVYTLTVHHDETIVLFGSTELNEHNNLHDIEGCYKYPCSDADAFYVRAKNSWFNDLWKLSFRGHWFYAEYVGGAVPTGYSYCTITWYGFRQRIIAYNFYPELLDVKQCVRIKDEK